MGRTVAAVLFDQQVSLSRQYFPQTVKIDPVLIGLDENLLIVLMNRSLCIINIWHGLEIASAAGAKVIV